MYKGIGDCLVLTLRCVICIACDEIIITGPLEPRINALHHYFLTTAAVHLHYKCSSHVQIINRLER